MKMTIKNRLVPKLIISLIVIFVGITSYTKSFDSFLKKTPVKRFDERAADYFDETLKRAFYTFAIARGINGIISGIQGTEIAVAPAGLGVTLTVGEILDPINDMVERFSWVMLVSTTSLGIQKVCMEIGEWLGLRIFLSFSMLLILAGIWLGKPADINLVSLGYKTAVLALVIRFCMPIIAAASDNIYDIFLKENYVESTTTLNKVKKQIKDPYELDEGESNKKGDLNFWEELKVRFLEHKKALDMKGKLAVLRDRVSNAVKYTIDLIIVFVLQTIIVPIGVLWFLLRLTGYVFGGNPARFMEKGFMSRISKPASPAPR